MTFVYSLGQKHIARNGVLTQCGLRARGVKPARSVPGCRWCGIAYRNLKMLGRIVEWAGNEPAESLAQTESL